MTAAAESMLENITDRIKSTANVETLYGESRQIGNKTIIPVAKVSYGFGAGGGEGQRPGESDETATGSGGGGGGGASARPVGFIVVDDSGVEFVHIHKWRGTVIAGLIGALIGLIVAKIFS